MRDRITMLDPLVVAGRDDLAARREHGAHRDATRRQAGLGLAEGQVHHVAVNRISLREAHGRLRYPAGR